MSTELRPIVEKHTTCKCCGALSDLHGVVDFHKNCEIYRRRVLDISAVPIYYYRCPECGFLFTTAFDHFTTDDFRRHIYNEDYILVDPDYQAVRPRANAATLCNLFSREKPPRVLDYGGGQGLLADLLLQAGFPQVDTYDPFVARHAERPAQRYDCVVSFEVVEHSTDPAGTFRDMTQFLTDRGLAVFSTLLQPPNIDELGLSWWYAGPRNGHVSLFSRASLLRVTQPCGFLLGSFSENLHMLFRELPPFAAHFLVQGG
jgi:hypothetical protein